MRATATAAVRPSTPSFGIDPLEVLVDRPRADAEDRRDLRVRLALGQPRQHLGLAATEPERLQRFRPRAEVFLAPDLLYIPEAGFSGIDTFTFRVSDGQLDSGVATVTVTVTPAAVLSGRMNGRGFVDDTRGRHTFTFAALETGEERGRFSLAVRQDRPRRRDAFVATAVTNITFSDDLAIDPGRPRAVVDSVVMTGTGVWNGVAGHAFELRAVDAGEPGRGRDIVSIVIKTGTGQVVETMSGTLDGGNVQSRRVRVTGR